MQLYVIDIKLANNCVELTFFYKLLNADNVNVSGKECP